MPFGAPSPGTSSTAALNLNHVIAGLDPAIHGHLPRSWLPWMPGSRPRMTEFSLAERIEALDQPGVGSKELLVGDAIGRHEVEGRAERPDIESVREIPVAERPALRRLVA